MACSVAGITSDANVLTNELRLIAQRWVLAAAKLLLNKRIYNMVICVCVADTYCSTRSQFPVNSWLQHCVTSNRPTPSLAVRRRSVIDTAHLMQHGNKGSTGSKLPYILPESEITVWNVTTMYLKIALSRCLCSQESGHLESRCSTSVGINTMASSCTKATQVETMEAGRPPASETTVL